MNWKFWRKNVAQPPHPQTTPRKEATGLFGYIFGRIEVLLLIALLAYNLHTLFVDYITKNATFIGDKDGQFYFATRLIGALLTVEIVLALTTAYFRNLNQWDKSLFTAFIAFLITVANHFTIVELFKDFADIITPEARTAIEWKMILSNALIFILGEAIGFVMHSKGQSVQGEVQEASILDRLENTLNRFNASPTAHNGLYDSIGNPVTGNTVFAEHKAPTPIGFTPTHTNKAGRKPLSAEKIAEIKSTLAEGKSMRVTAKICKVSLQKVHEVKHAIIG